MQGSGCRNHQRQTDAGSAVRQVFYADGEKESTGVIRAVLRELDLGVTQFDDLEECLDSVRTQKCHLLISNAGRPAEEGIRLLAAAKRIDPSVPVVLLVDHGDIQAAVRAMKGGAVDCLERPPERARLVAAIDSVLQESARESLAKEHPLSRTEEEVLHLILQGNTTAEAAQILSRSRRTVEVHRSHIMRKLGADSVVDLVKTSARMGLLLDWP